MYLRRITLLLFALFAAFTVAQRATAAEYQADWRGPAPQAGWAYLWNANGAIGTAANYSPLVWNEKARGYTVSSTAWPAPGEGGHALMTRTGGHAGIGSAQSDAKLSRYIIAAYTVPPGATGRLWIDGSILRPLGATEKAPGNSIDFRVYLGDKKVLSNTVEASDAYTAFRADVADATPGQVVYVCAGSPQYDVSNGLTWNFRVEFAPNGKTPKFAKLPLRESTTEPAPRFDTYGAPHAEWYRYHDACIATGKLKTTRLLFLGDSISHAWRWGDGKAVWDKRLAQYQPATFGFSGDTTGNLLWRIANGELDDIRPDVTVVLIGTNNINWPMEEMAAGTVECVKQIRAKLPNTQILVMSIWPRGEDPNADAGIKAMRQRITDANAIVARLDDGKTIHVIDIGNKLTTPDGKITKEIMRDYLHPTGAGYDIWVDAIQPYLDKYITLAAK
ncbi:MAG TPA: GDSL-type esterase/lipase family protein [Capsulimonadaceae bacterium]|jgi:lysophospholipase L1-like esterase